MAYIKTIYNNTNQINMGNLNKIDNELEYLDSAIEELKKKDIASISIISANCQAKTVQEGTKLTFTFTLSDDNKINCDVIIPKDIASIETKSK